MYTDEYFQHHFSVLTSISVIDDKFIILVSVFSEGNSFKNNSPYFRQWSPPLCGGYFFV